MTPENERIRGYLQSQAAAKTIPELVDRVREGATELHEAARTFNADQFATVPEGDTWSPRDCLTHVVGWNMANAVQVLNAAWTGEAPEADAPELPAEAEAMLAKHDEALESLYVHVLEADPQAFPETTWEHPMFGPLNWREWLLFLRIHCKDHAGQLQAMREALG